MVNIGKVGKGQLAKEGNRP